MEQGNVIGIFVLLLLGLGGLIPVKIASERNLAGSPLLWWIAGMLLFPITLLVAIFMKPDPQAVEEKALSSGTEKKCPKCAELVKAEAKVCRFCQHEFTPTVAGNKDCPACGESIMREAVRCRFCGHTFQRQTRRL